MRFPAFLALFFLALFSIPAFASQLNIVSPVQQTLVLPEHVLDLGVIGPGQTVEVVAERGSGVIAKESQTKGEALWDQLFVVRESLPAGWKADDSKLFENPFHAFVTASPTAGDGEYAFQLKAFDQYDGAGEKVFSAKVRISKDLLEQSVDERKIVTGVGLPAVLQIKLRNKSSASDVFELKASGVSSSWAAQRRVFVRFNSEEAVEYEILPGEQGEFGIGITSTSLSSPLISASSEITIQAVSSLEQDLRALNKGLLLFPTVEQVVYSALSLVSYLVYK
ncbi:MAG TPA: hypothetical protein VI875_00820 [Candidatus Norongarragalinales archaeon]|nr:hypothetical protein [Candidatus Norongarragalinales archaeon]